MVAVEVAHTSVTQALVPLWHVRSAEALLLTGITIDNGDNCLRPGSRVFQLGQLLVALQPWGSGVRLSTT